MSNQPTGENPNPPSSTGARRLMKLTSLIDMSVNTVRGKWIKISRSKAGLLLTHTAYPVWFTNVRCDGEECVEYAAPKESSDYRIGSVLSPSQPTYKMTEEQLHNMVGNALESTRKSECCYLSNSQLGDFGEVVMDSIDLQLSEQFTEGKE